MVINLALVAKLLSPSLFYFGLIGLIPAVFGLFKLDISMGAFVLMTVVSVILSIFLGGIGRRAKIVLTLRDLFLFTVSLWVILSLIAAIPIYFFLDDVSICGSIFESASALSTTGATVIDNLEERPLCILLWRSILQYLGGIGFVVIGVAVLPSFSLGGVSLFKTESTSFDENAKITPHLKTMALAVLGWYLAMTFLCIAGYKLCGLDWFVAINTAMCTVATGGMMPLDESMNALSPAAHYVAMAFMYLGSIPFFAVLAALCGNFKKLFCDEQIKGYTLLIIIVTAIVTLSLILHNDYPVEKGIRVALFNVISVLSSSGFALEDFTLFNSFCTVVFLFILAVGGCSGSTAGGIKIFRVQVLWQIFYCQLIRTLHPRRIMEPRYNKKRIESDAIASIICYLCAYVLFLILSTAVAVMLGLNIADALTATVTCLSNIGPAMGPQLGPSNNFASLNDSLHLLFAFDMLIGRLEIIPVLLILTKGFWKV